MSFSWLTIGKIGMNESHNRIMTLFFESHCDRGFFAKRVWRHPSVLNLVWPLDFGKTTIVGSSLKKPIKKPIDLRIEEEFFCCIPSVSLNFGVKPAIEYFFGRSGDYSFYFKLQCLFRSARYFFSVLLFLKWCSNLSRRSVQNRS